MVRRIAFILLVTALLAAGCSSGDDAGSSAHGVDLGDVGADTLVTSSLATLERLSQLTL